MRKINRQNEPDFWKGYRKKHPKESYADMEKSTEGNEARRELRRFLVHSQYGLCAYCCKRIGLDNSLNEHIKPQALYPNKTMDYENLVACCRGEGVAAVCGASKKDKYDEKLFVSPLEDGCDKAFVFYPNGQIDGVGEQGKYTCRLLNLDAYELRRARMAQYRVCAGYKDAEMVYSYFLIPDEEGKLEAYSDMVQFFYERGDFGVV